MNKSFSLCFSSFPINTCQTQHSSPHPPFGNSSTNLVSTMVCFSRIGFFWGLFLLAALACEARVLQNSGFVQTRNTQFILNGSPFFFNGFNSYWLMHISAEPSQRNKVSDVFRQASAAGLSVCRTWAFSDGGYQALQISPGVYDERVFQVFQVLNSSWPEEIMLLIYMNLEYLCMLLLLYFCFLGT